MSEVKLEYSISQVKNAGKILRDQEPGSPIYSDALEAFANWRKCHTVPLNQFHDALQQHARAGGIVASVVHRPKRIEAVIKKLRRNPKAQLSTMQDIAGCRVIVRNIEDVEAFAEACKKLFSQHGTPKVYPYIEEPNPKTGYRGVHLVYSFRSEHEAFNG